MFSTLFLETLIRNSEERKNHSASSEKNVTLKNEYISKTVQKCPTLLPFKVNI